MLNRINFILIMTLVFGLLACTGNKAPTVSIVTDSSMGEPVAHGIDKLVASLENRHITYEQVTSLDQVQGEMLLVAGLSLGRGAAASLIQDKGSTCPEVPEALALWKTEVGAKSAWVINGFDDRGLMYGLLDVADRVIWSTEKKAPFAHLEAVVEKPDVTTRAISMYTMNRKYWESRFYDEDYWERYMELLASNRFNSVVVILGYENGGFLAPCYPYFFDVDGYPNIGMDGMTATEQQRNLAALNRMIKMAHERGLDFKVGIWDHIYRGGVQTGGISEEELAAQNKDHLVRGLDADNLSAYTKAALEKFIQMVPDMDGIQLRMHNESGLKRGKEMEIFWTEVFGMFKASAPDFQIDLRAKELPESIIQIASEMELNFTITTKYWMEQMGLPFHPTHINRENQQDRRHGYADMLRYPREYRMHWRMWNGGTQRVLLWGSPAYARRFAESTHLYDGEGFEINEPLATKMEAQPHDMEPFDLLNPPYVYYEYEFERYWHFFQVFGRLAYNPETSPELWSREFENRFGKETGPILQEALHKASWVLPTIVAACSPYAKFPTTRGWAGKQRFGSLPLYSKAEGSDIQQFASFDTEAKLLIDGGETASRLPSSTSLWFEQMHLELETLMARAEELGPGVENKEFISTLTDLSILSNLSLYHSRRIPAAVSYCIYKRTGDPYALDDAIAYESKAIEAWSGIVKAAGDVYAPDLMMGIRSAPHRNMNHHLSGHWKEELGYLKEEFEELKAERSAPKDNRAERSTPEYMVASGVKYQELFQIQHQALKSSPVGHDMKVSATINASAGIKWVRLRYRSVNQKLDYLSLPMTADTGGDLYQVVVPASQVDQRFDFMYFIEVMDNHGNGRIYPDLEVETPYKIVVLER